MKPQLSSLSNSKGIRPAIMSLVRAFLGAFKEFYKNSIREVVAI